MLASWALEIQIWRGFLRVLGAHLAWLPAVRIWFLSAIVRYVPGSVWQPLSMTLYAQKHGIRPEVTLTSFLLYQAVILLAATPLAAAYFLILGNWGLLTGWVGAASGWLIVGMLLPIAIFLFTPAWLVGILNWALLKAKRAPIHAILRRGSLFLLLVAGAVNWLLWGATFAALTFGVSAFAPGEVQRLAPHLVIAYPIAYAIGFLSLITPSGFGVREGALYVLLAPIMPGSVITVAALAMRVWNLAGELIMALASALLPDRVIETVDAAMPDATPSMNAHLVPSSLAARKLSGEVLGNGADGVLEQERKR